MKKFILLCITLFIFTACSKESSEQNNQSSKNETSQTTTTQTKRKVQINFYAWPETYSVALVETFNASQDEVEVTLVELPIGEYETKITTLLAGGAGDIDVYAQKRQSDMFPHYKNGFIEPLESYIDKNNYNLNAITSSLDYIKMDGEIVALPFRSGAYYIYYNKNIFDAAGIPYPNTYVEKGEWTWDKFVEVSKTLSDSAEDVYGSLIYTWGSIQVFPHAQAGGVFIDDNGNIGTLKEPLRTSVNVRKELEEYGAMIPLNELRVSKEHYSTIFYAGKTGMLPIGEWFPGFMIKGRDENLLQGYTWDDWGLTRLPCDTEEYVTTGAPTFAHIYAGSKKKDAAFKFLAWMSEAEGGAKVMANLGILPAAINDDVKDILASSFPDEESLKYFVEDKHTVPAMPLNKYGTQAEQAFSQTLDLYLYEGYTFDEYYAELEKKLQEVVRVTK